MSQIPALTGGRALEHDIALEAGKGFKVKGQTALVSFLSGATNLMALKSEAIAMADAAHTLIVTGTAAAAQTKVTSNVLIVDPQSSGSTENLDLPAEASSTGLFFLILNSGGEGIVVRNDGGGTIITIDTNQHGLVYCDGTTWRGFIGGIT